MSQFGNKIGEARIEFVGDTKQLDAAAAEAVATTNKAAASAAGGSASRSVRTLNEQLKNSVTQVTSLFSKLAAAGGIAATFFNIGKAIREAVVDNLKTANERAAEFTATLTSPDAETRLKAMRDEVSRLNSEIAGISEADFATRFVRNSYQFRWFFDSADKLKQQRDAINEQAVAIERTLAGLRERKDIEAAAANTAAADREAQANIAGSLLESQRSAIEASREHLTERERIIATLDDELDKLDQVRDAQSARGRGSDKALDSELSRLEAVFRRRAELSTQAIDREAAETEKKMRVAYAKALEGALESVRARANDLFNVGDLTFQMGRVADGIEAMTRQSRGWE